VKMTSGDDNWEDSKNKWESDDKWAAEDKWESDKDNWASSERDLYGDKDKWDHSPAHENSIASPLTTDMVEIDTDKLRSNMKTELHLNTPALTAIGFAGGFIQGNESWPCQCPKLRILEQVV
jgi:hypothetical protein